MAQQETQNKDQSATESRQANRAFRRAMSSGLSKTYDHVATHSVPEDFMNLLRQADRRKMSGT